MKTADTAIASAVVLGISVFAMQTALAFGQSWRPAMVAPSVAYDRGIQRHAVMPSFRPIGTSRQFDRGYRNTSALPQPRSSRSYYSHGRGGPNLARQMTHRRFARSGYAMAPSGSWATDYRPAAAHGRWGAPTSGLPASWRQPAYSMQRAQRGLPNLRRSASFARGIPPLRSSRSFTRTGEINARYRPGMMQRPAAPTAQAIVKRSKPWRPVAQTAYQHRVSLARPLVARSTGHIGVRTNRVTAPVVHRVSSPSPWDRRWRPMAQPVAPVRTTHSHFRPPSPERLSGVSRQRSSPHHAAGYPKPHSALPGWVTTYEAPVGRAACVWCNGS